MSTVNQFRLKLFNISCASCVKRIETTLTHQSNIDHFQVNFAERTINIEGTSEPEQVIKILEKIGYKARLDNNTEINNTAVQSSLIAKTIVAGSIGVGLLILGLSPWQPSLNTITGQIIWLVLGLLSAWGIWYAGWHIYQNAFKAFLNHHATMDTLITIGTGAAWIYSMIVSIAPNIVPDNAVTRHFIWPTSATSRLVHLG